ncbi:amino acid adenylation domain-containing protein [uncultured Winogradskyella sp.]|uniref:non-ribosomal peptide synthetase n=1 Tax=uncultured Winogradskyella sp. TaxID=395353 RepID=UPI0030D7CF49|tara:strand:+ start:13426 stop:17415 length:3990 start_codon:yes stop_codon:yes gene_type:complete
MDHSEIKKQISTTFNPFLGLEVERIVYTTQSQAEIWIACKIGGEDANRAYNESISVIFNGNLNKIALTKAIQKIVQRHQSFRATFSTDGRYMTIFKEVNIELEYLNLSTKNGIEKEATIKTYLNKDANFIFDLVRGPLIKIGLIELSNAEYHLVITAHHIIFDGWSTGILLEELGALYTAFDKNEIPVLPEAESFVTYADSQQLFINSKDYSATENFWLDQFKSSVPVLSLPTDAPRPKLRTFKSERLDFSIPNLSVNALKKVGIKAGCSFVTTLMSAFEVFLYNQTGQDDLVLGLPASGQASSGKTQLIGHCVNLLPLRSHVDANSTFNTYLKQRKTQLFDAYDYQELSFGQLIQKLNVDRDPSRVPLVPVVFNIDIGMTSAVSFGDLKYKLKSNPRAYEAFELFLNAVGSENELILEWSYNAALFSRDTISKMMASFEAIITKIIENPDIQISKIVAVDETEYKQLNNTSTDYPQEALHDLISSICKEFSSETAIKFQNEALTYNALEEQANQLAHHLQSIGVRPGEIIGVALPRSKELIITLLAILKSGAAYLPLDPLYPKKRLEYMLDDSEASYLISTKANAAILDTKSTKLYLSDLFSKLSDYTTDSTFIKVNTNAVAYLLYTSGSTGKPKGVSVTHKNLVNFLYSILEKPGIKQTDKLLSVTSISFDISGLELFAPLLKGGTLVIADEITAKDGRLLYDLLKKEKITLMQATPSTWQMLLDAGWEEPIHLKALCGGEALTKKLADTLLSKVHELWNMYGPTETTIWSTLKQIKSKDYKITIGQPIANTQVYILNKQGHLVVPGKLGEIVIGGDGVAKGYWKRPELTIEKFIDNPFQSDTKLYKTGDLGQLLPTGELVCLGRIDDQVKIRGHRIELGEIEQAITTINTVDAAVVIVHTNQLYAYILSSQLNEINKSIEDAFKTRLAEYLPAYMIPYNFVLIDEFPKTLNGKIDRKVLLEIASKTTIITHFSAPRTTTEKLVSKIWCDCLNLEKVDIYTNFFELGGHSLIAVKVMSRLEKETGNRFPLSALMVYPTVAKLAEFMDKDAKQDTWDSLVPIRPNGTKSPLYVVHGAGHNVLFFNSLADNLDKTQPVYGLQAKGLNGVDKPYDKIEDMAAHYISEIIQVDPIGPYALAGYSFGGIIAYEMARQLKAQGRHTKTLALFDTYIFPEYYFSGPIGKALASGYYVFGKVFFAIRKMFSSTDNFKIRLRIFKNAFLRVKSMPNTTENLQEENYKQPKELDKMHDIAVSRYKIVPHDISVDLLIADDNVYFKHDTKNLGWKSIALGGITKTTIPGNHGNMFIAPNDKKLGRILQNLLDSRDESS